MSGFSQVLNKRFYQRASGSVINELAHSAFDADPNSTYASLWSSWWWSQYQIYSQSYTSGYPPSDSEDDIDMVTNGDLSVSHTNAIESKKRVEHNWNNLEYWKIEAETIKDVIELTTFFDNVNGIEYEYNPYFSRYQTDIDCHCDWCNTIIYCDDSFWPQVDMKISYTIYPMALLLVKK